MTKVERIAETIESVRNFRFCGPSDDPDEQTAVTAGFRHLVVQLQRLAAPLLPDPERKRLNSIDVEYNDIFSVYDANAEVESLLYDIEEALEHADIGSLATASQIVQPTVIDRLQEASSHRFDTSFLVRLCNEINSCFAHGNMVATALTMRTVLNHVPPVFGKGSFKDVAAQSGRSHRDMFEHLEGGLRKIADYLGHGTIGGSVSYPSASQVEPYKPQFELLLNEVCARLIEDISRC